MMDVLTVFAEADRLDTDDLVVVTTRMGDTVLGRVAWPVGRGQDLTVRVDGTICRTPLTLVTRIDRVVCEHGSQARHVLLVDQTRKTPRDPYGDVEGPISVDRVGAMVRLRDVYADGREPSRFTLAFIHADRCRTER